MNPDTPPHRPRRSGHFIRYSFAVMAGGAFAWLAWIPNPPPDKGGNSDGDDRDTHAALSPWNSPRINSSEEEDTSTEDASALTRSTRQTETGALAGAEQTHDLRDSVTQTASSADMEDATTADLHSRGPP